MCICERSIFYYSDIVCILSSVETEKKRMYSYSWKLTNQALQNVSAAVKKWNFELNISTIIRYQKKSDSDNGEKSFDDGCEMNALSGNLLWMSFEKGSTT